MSLIDDLRVSSQRPVEREISRGMVWAIRHDWIVGRYRFRTREAAERSCANIKAKFPRRADHLHVVEIAQLVCDVLPIDGAPR